MTMLHNEYLLSECNDSDTLKSAARVVAKRCLDGALDNQYQNDQPATYEALKAWGFCEIIDVYAGDVLNWGDDETHTIINEPQYRGTWYDQVRIDTKDAELWASVLTLAALKLEEMAKEL